MSVIEIVYNIVVFKLRGLEIRTLCLFEESSTNPFNIDEVKDQNILLKESNGDFTFHFNVFKTSKYMGHDEVTVEVSLLT